MKTLLALICFFAVHTAAAQQSCNFAGSWVGDTVMMRADISRANRNEVRTWEAEKTLRLRSLCRVVFNSADSSFEVNGLNVAFDDEPNAFTGRYSVQNDTTLQFKRPADAVLPEGSTVSVPVRCLDDGRLAFVHPKDGQLYWVVLRRQAMPTR